MHDKSSFPELIDISKVVGIAIEAGRAVMEIYQKDFNVEYKEDCSPLTEADLHSNEIICSHLKKLWPDIPILSEENKEVPYDERRMWESYWCIDPIDGTKEFVKKSGEFTINIALIHKNSPVAGVVFAPALGEIYFAQKGEGAYKLLLDAPHFRPGENLLDSARRLPLNPGMGKKRTKHLLVIVASKSHLNDETKRFIDEISKERGEENTQFISKGSSLKLLMIAEGSADLYPRLGPTMEWDTAAADAIVRESGKMTYEYEEDRRFVAGDLSQKGRTPLKYNKMNLLNPWFIVY